jgi:hypothetical protein
MTEGTHATGRDGEYDANPSLDRLLIGGENVRKGVRRDLAKRTDAGPNGSGKPVTEKTRKRPRKPVPRRPKPRAEQREEQILQKAQIYLLFEAKRPMLWTVAGIREEKGADGSRRWVIAVHLRYPTGFEGYLGDLLYDGEKITELTELNLMKERARQIAADPEGLRQWNEYRSAILPPGKA